MKIIEFNRSERNTKNALEVLDNLRSLIESGEVVAFAAVGIEPDDVTRMWCSCTTKVSNLRMMGAIATLQYHYHNDPGVHET